MRLLHQDNHRLRIVRRITLDFPPHLHNAMELIFLRTGSVTVLSGGQRFTLEPGDVFVAFPNQDHGYQNSTDVEALMLIVPAEPYLTAFRSTIDQKRPRPPVLKRGQWEHTGVPVLLEMLYTDRETASGAVISGYLLALIGKLLPLLELHDAPSSSADVFQASLLYLNDHYREPLTRSGIAKAVGCNESYLSHLFSDALSITLTDYLTSLRIQEALTLLTDTAAPISQIALSLGFGSIRSFNRAFRQQMHLSPSAYRRQIKQQ